MIDTKFKIGTCTLDASLNRQLIWLSLLHNSSVIKSLGQPLGRNTTNKMKWVILKFVSQKRFEAMFQRKKGVNTKNKVFVTHSICPYYRYLWGKFKDLQRKSRISHVFCLGAVVMIRVTENSPAINILHEKDLMVYQECPPDSVWKIFFLFLGLS